MNFSAVEILLVEDNEGDVCLLREALHAAKVHNNITVAADGVEALDCLHRRGAYVDAPRPDVILLDLNLPRMDGRQVLGHVKADPALASIPIVVLSSSAAEQDVVKAYDLHANCYVVKPVDFDKMKQIVKAIEQFWFAVVKLPPNSHD